MNTAKVVNKLQIANSFVHYFYVFIKNEQIFKVNKTAFMAHRSTKIIKKRLPIALFNRVIVSYSIFLYKNPS